MIDSLTGLPNRELFNSMIERALSDCPPGAKVAVLLMDLDRFKEINDSLGHFNGDLVIERVGKRLRTVLREGDQVARLGGDEFAMLLPNVHAKDSVTGAAQRIHDALSEPFSVGGLALNVEASIGSALYPPDVDKAGKLMQAADVAMYAAKKAAQRARVLLARPAPVHARAAGPGRAAEPRDGGQGAGAALPAEGAPGDGHGRGRRGAGALEPPAARAAVSRRVHPGDRAHVDDPPADDPPAGDGPGAVRCLEPGRPRAERGGQPLGPAAAGPRAAARDRPDALARGHARLQARGRDHRERDHVRPPPRPSRAGPDARDGRARGHRRLRHRLLVAGVAQAAARQHDQDRQVLRDEHGGRPRRCGHRAFHRRRSAATSACRSWRRAWRPRPPGAR